MRCVGCSEHAHTYCATSALAAVPLDPWQCDRCTKPPAAVAGPSMKRPVTMRPRAPPGGATAVPAAVGSSAAAPPPPKTSLAASSGVGSILANAIWKKNAPAAAAAAPQLYSGRCVVAAVMPAGGVVWRGSLALDAADTELDAAGTPLGQLRAVCVVVARPPAAGNPGAGSEGVSRAVAAGAMLPDRLELTWRPAAAEWAAWEVQPLALLRISAATSADEKELAALETALEAHVEQGALAATLPHATLLLRTAAALPAALRPPAKPSAGALQRPPACIYGLLLEPPPAALSLLPSRDARPARGILRRDAAAADQPAPELPAPHAPPPGAALRGLRFTLLGYGAGDPAAGTAVDAALREGAAYEVAPAPHNVDLVVLEPSLVHRLPEFPLRLPDFAAIRAVRFAAGARHVEACATARRVLDPRTDTRCELFPDGAMIVTDANTLAGCDGAARDVLALLCRCAAATNALAAAAAHVPLGERLPKPPAWPWRIMLNPLEWTSLQFLSKPAIASSTSARAAEAVAALEEAMSTPGPGVGTTGAPRMACMVPEEVSRSTVADPPQVVRDAVKLAHVHAAGCRHVLLMSSTPAVLDSARQQRSIVAGDPAAVCAFLQGWLEQIRAAHRSTAPAAAAAEAEPAADAPPTKALRFSAVLDDGGTRRGYRGYSPPPERAPDEAAGAESERPAARSPPASRKREREGAALGAAWTADGDDK